MKRPDNPANEQGHGPPPSPRRLAEASIVPCGVVRLASGYRVSRCVEVAWTDPKTGRTWLRCTECLYVRPLPAPEAP